MILDMRVVEAAQDFVHHMRKKGVDEEDILDMAYGLEIKHRSYSSDEERQIIEQAGLILTHRSFLVDSLSTLVEENLRFLTSPDRLWQPGERGKGPAAGLPDFATEDWQQRISEIQKHARGIPDDVFIVLIGNMVTEEALPNYKAILDKIAVSSCVFGKEEHPLAVWGRWWTAEEERHGIALRDYVAYSGKANMLAVDRSIQSLLRNGFDPRIGKCPYKMFVYTSFQEGATEVSHKNTALIAKEKGDGLLYRLCTAISSDEARHEKFYKTMMKHIFDVDPHGGMLAFARQMRNQITMPAETMSDGVAGLYEHFALVAQKLRVYTVEHYADILEDLNAFWDVSHRNVSGAAEKAQRYLLRLPEMYRKRIAPLIERQIDAMQPRQYAWLYGREV